MPALNPEFQNGHEPVIPEYLEISPWISDDGTIFSVLQEPSHLYDQADETVIPEDQLLRIINTVVGKRKSIRPEWY